MEAASTRDKFFISVDEALVDPTDPQLLLPIMTVLDALHEEEGNSELITHTAHNHRNEDEDDEDNEDNEDEEQQQKENDQNAGLNVLLLEGDVTLPDVVSGIEYVEFLEKEVLAGSLLDARNQRQKQKILLKLARDLEVLPPPNPSLDLDFEVSQWRHIVNELIKEMRVVVSQCTLETSKYGVYVLTCTPYGAFLEMLVATLSEQETL